MKLKGIVFVVIVSKVGHLQNVVLHYGVIRREARRTSIICRPNFD